MADELLKIDRDLADDVVFSIGSEKVNIKFQFPPKILVDNRSGSWEEVEVPGDQPISVYKTSGARKMTLEWTYVIGARGWTTQNVRDEITHLRAYYTPTKKDNLADCFIVRFKIWKLGGPESMTCRLGNIDISHGKALFVQHGDINLAHPVITNIKVAIQPWIRGGDPGSAALEERFPHGPNATKEQKAAWAKAQAKLDLKHLDYIVLPEWQ